jgi:hypothetical protein
MWLAFQYFKRLLGLGKLPALDLPSFRFRSYRFHNLGLNLCKKTQKGNTNKTTENSRKTIPIGRVFCGIKAQTANPKSAGNLDPSSAKPIPCRNLPQRLYFVRNMRLGS